LKKVCASTGHCSFASPSGSCNPGHFRDFCAANYRLQQRDRRIVTYGTLRGETTKNLLPLSVTTTAGILIASGANAACQRSCTEVAEKCVSMGVREPRALRTRATV
jgi:hypothetical protein